MVKKCEEQNHEKNHKWKILQVYSAEHINLNIVSIIYYNVVLKQVRDYLMSNIFNLYFLLRCWIIAEFQRI